MATQSVSRGKVTKHGIEVPSALTYKSWEPGGEYTKPLVLKNVHLTSKKIRYKMPQSQIFSTVFPQPIVLGSGTSHTLPITFKPLEKRVVADNIEISTSDGSFTVPLRAILPTPNLSLPSSLQFGMCAVSDEITMEFTLTNITNLLTNFQWEVPTPFRVIPHYGLIQPKGVCKLQASFHPEAVSVFEGNAVCYYGDGQNYKKSVKLEGIGKYPHLVVSTGGKSPPSTDLSLSFGGSPIGETVVKCLHITNVSSVSSSFDITTTVPNMVFSCSEYTGTISPEQVYKIKVIFQPQLVGCCSGHFSIKPRGGISGITVKCTGRGQGAELEITESYVNFGNIACGTSTAHVIHIKNNQSIKAVYQFQMITANGGVFTTEAASGVVDGGSTNSVLIHFTPTRPIPYHKKLVCLVHHMHQPITVDLIGTGYTETTRPTVLLGKHLSMYTDRVEAGLSRYSPEQLQQLISSGKLKEDDTSLLPTESFNEALEKPPVLDCSYGGYLSGSHDPTSHHITADTTLLDFDGQVTENKVDITNHTMGKLYCIWTIGANNVFSVIPEERELIAGACCTFTVTFRPNYPNKYYSDVLDCYICYKSMREQQDNDVIITAPWCISVTVRGSGFVPSSEPYQPRALFTPCSVVMPPTSLRRDVHQTVVMSNNGNSPIAYDFEQHSDYTIHPSRGLLEDNHQVFIVSARCSQSTNNQHIIKAVLNGSDKYTEDLLLHVMVDSPRVSLEHDGTLYFMPTCIQCSQTNTLTVTNTTCLQLNYHWRLLDECSSELLCVHPTSGTLLPYESQTHLWNFTPANTIMYKLEAQLVSTSSVDPSQKCKSLLKITGQGELGHLKADPDSVELSTVVVGSSTTTDITIHNLSSCELSFCLSTSLHVLHLDCSHSNVDNPAGVELSVNEDSIPAGGKKMIRVKMRPCVRGQHTLTVTYQLNLPRDVVRETICSITFNAVYPTMTVTGLIGQGSLADLSKSRLWSMFSIDKFNRLLQQDPSPSELRYALKTRYSTRRKAAVHTTAIVEVTFGASPVGPVASSIQLQVENMGNTPTQWAFQLPEDIFLEPAYWADTGELDQIEKDEMRMMDNEVFRVHPRSGHLDPGCTNTITLSYRHIHYGSSRLPVLLKIGGGREVLLFFHGVTVPSGQPYVMFTSYHHHFSTVPIGCHAFPRQVYELYNGGDKLVKYSIDTAPLEQLRQENYGVSVIECLQPVGEVPARSSTAIQFVFSPQEVKTYIVELPIQFDQHKTVLVSFTGRGYDPSQLEPPGVADTSLAFVTSNNHDITISASGSSLLTVNQAVTLSHETVSFGHLPLFASVSRIIFLRNNTKHTVSWKLPPDTSHQVLTLSPSSGYLQPMDMSMCRVVFFSQSAPQLYHFTILCELMDETAVMSYKQQLEVWKEKEEERQHLFTITDDLKKYQALPPIGQSSQLDYEQWNKLDLSVKPNTRPRTKKQAKSPPSQPKPPEPFYLQLTITATTHTVSDYSQQFNNFHLFFIDRQAVSMGCSLPQHTTSMVSREESEVVTSITTLMLKDLLSDNNFNDAVRSITEEPLPFFTQYSQRDRNTGGQAHARHSYAAALEHLSKDQQLMGHMMPHEDGHEDMTSEGYNISQKTGDTVVEYSSTSSVVSVGRTGHVCTNNTEQLIMLEDSIKHLPDFHSLVEDVLNGTILNVVQETISGEATITKLLPTIATP